MQAHTVRHSSSATAPPRGRSSAVAVGWSRLQRCSRSNQQDTKCYSGPRERTKWYGVYTDEQYQAQRQSEERARWAASVRDLTGDRSHPEWAAAAGGGSGGLLDPPALLGGVTVVIISPRKPVTVGTVARACGSFECEDLRIVMPRQQSYITRRHAKSASKGAQYILYGAGHYDSIAEATADCDVRVAFTRWAQASSPHVYKVDINGLTAHPAVQRVVTAPLEYRPGPPPPPSAPSEAAAAEAEAAEARLAGTASPAGTASDSGTASDGAESDASDVASAEQGFSASAGEAQTRQQHASQRQQDSESAAMSGVGQGGSSDGASAEAGCGAGHGRPPKVALVFGREELGMSDEEVDSCEVCCSVPIGRLQESLSLSHAVSIALCAIYQARLQHLASSSSSSSGTGSSSSSGQGGVGGTGPSAGRGSVKIDASTGMVSRAAAAAS